MLPMLVPLAALPWLSGFDATAIADHASPAVTDALAAWHEVDPACVDTVYGGLALDADLAPAPGTEKLLASFSQGIAVLDRDGGLVARAPGFACAGSADELVAVAAGDAWIGSPVIALAATTGGHAESLTWLSLYRVEGDQLVSVFTGVVEDHDGHHTRTGAVLVAPGGLIYQAPSGATSVWSYDRTRGRYVALGGAGPMAER
jgi:hypothetical protein